MKIRATHLQKNLAFDRSRRGNELAVLHTLGGDQLSSDFMHLFRFSPDHDDLQTVVLIQVNVKARVDDDLGLVLHICEKIPEPMGPVIVNKADDSNDFFIGLADFFLYEMVADQVPYGLGAVGVAELRDAAVK